MAVGVADHRLQAPDTPTLAARSGVRAVLAELLRFSRRNTAVVSTPVFVASKAPFVASDPDFVWWIT